MASADGEKRCLGEKLSLPLGNESAMVAALSQVDDLNESVFPLRGELHTNLISLRLLVLTSSTDGRASRL
jgi:hypothetical protein